MKVGNGRLNAAAILSADIKASFLQLFAVKEHCHIFGACVAYVGLSAVEKLHALIFVKQVAARRIGVYIEILYTVFRGSASQTRDKGGRLCRVRGSAHRV